jgi:hypothetical protein
VGVGDATRIAAVTGTLVLGPLRWGLLLDRCSWDYILLVVGLVEQQLILACRSATGTGVGSAALVLPLLVQPGYW